MTHLALFRHCLRPSNWRARRPAGRNFQSYDRLRYSSEPPFDVESKLYTHLIVTQRTSELQPDFTSIPPLPQLEKPIAPNFRLNKDDMTDESPRANALAPRCFVPSTCECGVLSVAAPTTAPRLGNEVSAGHRPRLVSLRSF